MMNRPNQDLRIPGALSSAAALLALCAARSAQTDPYMERTWGGETRQVFTLDVPPGDRHVWNVGDGALIRHAVNPGSGVTWTVQEPPSDVTQNLLDVHFIDGGASGPPHLGFAVGVGGHVLTSPDYGATWVHLDSGDVQNELSPSEDATLWRGRFLSEDDGFVCGLWTFQRWNGTSWNTLTLQNSDGSSTSANLFEFYALELLVDPNDPSRWVGVAAGQRWGSAGGGHGSVGSVFYASSSVNGGNTWKEVFRLQGLSGGGLSEYQDPWDIAFEPNPTAFNTAVGYMSVGTGHPDGAVFRTTNGGRSWSSTPDLVNALTLYGIGVLGPDDAFAVGYGGQVWVRDSSGWTCRRGTGTSCALPSGVTETQTAPLAGAHGAGSDMYATGSWGYLHVSTDGFVTDTIELDPSSSDGNSEHWRFADLHFTSALTGYAVSANKTIIESPDGGVQWDLSTSSPNSLTGTGTTPLQAVEFRDGGGSGVAAGWGQSGTLAPFTAPTLQEGFAYWKHETLSASWTASQLQFTLGRTWLLLDDVAWAQGDGATAEFWAVGIAGDGASPYALTNHIPMLLRSTDGGATWSDGNSGGTIPASVRLNAIAFRSTTEGFAVGWNTSTGTSVAYRIDVSGGAPALAPVAISSGATNELLDVTGNSSYVAACGKNETVLVYNGASFVAAGGVPSLGFASPKDFLCISAPPGGGLRTLIGARTSVDEVDAPGIGKMLYYDAGWMVIDAATNKGVAAVQLRDSGGFGLAGGSGLANSGEFGIVADSATLRFVEPGP